MKSHDELLYDVAAYALGALSSAEAESAQEHLQTCDACRDEYRTLQPAVTAVAYSAEAWTDAAGGAAVVSPLLKARVMKRVRAEAARQSQIKNWPAYAFAAACLALAIVTGFADLALNARLQRETAQARTQSQIIADLSAPDAQRYAFAGGALVRRGDHLYLTMRDLPAPPKGRTYQAWTLAKGATKMSPSQTFEPSAGVAVVPVSQTATTLVAVAVSVEPMGGSQQPTTKPIALVKM